MVVWTVLIERSDSFGDEIDIDASPPLLMEKQSIGAENGMECTGVHINTLRQSESFGKLTDRKIFSELGEGKLHGLELQTIERERGPIVQKIDESRTDRS
jgi:hypothetical protein